MVNDLLTHGFSLGRVHVLEEKMLSSNEIERLLEADSVNDMVHILSESDYGMFVNKVENETDIEQSLNSYTEYIFNLADELGVPVKAKDSGFPLSKKISKKKIDIANIKNYLYSDNFENEFLVQGNFTKEDFMSGKVIDKDTQKLLDKDFDNFVIDLLAEVKYQPTKADRIVAFIQAKLIEIKNVRLLLFSGLNNLSTELIKKNIRSLYV